ncbi:MAG: hypothetical protein IH828_10290 [Nitrospinae bacterium]|nr:hypothetical protein [Nitrospinota bacterium]
MLHRYVFSLLGMVLLLLGAGSSRAQEGWVSLVPGLEYRVVAWELPETGFGADLQVLRADPEVVRLKVLDARDFGGARLTVREFANRTGALAVINGGFTTAQESGTFASQGFPEIAYERIRTDVIAQGGIPNLLMVITVRVWADDNGNVLLDAGESVVELHTKMARSIE